MVTRDEVVDRIRAAALWISEKELGRDVFVAAGALLVARGVSQLVPGMGTVTLGLIVLYVALWHGPLTAYLLRVRSRKE